MTKKNTVIIATVFIVTCTISAYLWVTHTNLSYFQTQKQLYSAKAGCETLILNLTVHGDNTPDSRQIISKITEKFQRHINEVNLADKTNFIPSIKTLHIEFERLVSMWQSELLPQVRKISSDTKIYFNTSDRTDLIKELNHLCTGFEQISDSINDTAASPLITNNYIYSFSIIILSLLVYFIFRYYRNSYVNGYSEKNEFQKNIAQTTETKSDIQQYKSSLDIAIKALTQLVEEPESTEPFTLFLNEIEKLTNATSSAIFITPNSASQPTLLTCTDLNDKDWSEAIPSRILPKVTYFDTTNKIIKIFEEAVLPEHKFICVRLHQGSQDSSLLVLKLASNIESTDSTILTLLEHSNRLANIVSSVRLAQLKLRHAQYEERAVIARELHDSLAQSLSYLKIQTSRLQSILTGSDIQAYSKSMEIDAMMQDLRSNLNIAYRHLRELISTFRLTIGGKNFSQALTDSVEEFAKRSGIAFDIDNRLPADILTVTEETQLLHIIRESLSNVVRHSQAKFTLLSIHYNKSGQITTVIEDDGIGLPDVSNPEQHFGIIIMQERAHSIGGNISLTERVDGGACLKIVFQASKHIDAISNIN